MSMSLRDQLMQAGLISEKQARQANKQKHEQRRQQARGQPPPVDEQKLAAQRALQAKVDRDAELNRQLREKVEAKMRRAEIRQLIGLHRLAKPAGDEYEYYNFIDGRKIKRLPITPEQRKRLVSGDLEIARFEGRYDLVPKAIAQRLREKDPRAVIARGESGAVDENDPYKDYVVPDDLMW